MLLADDNADMRRYVRRLLLTAGYTVEAVADGTTALAAARRQTPDLLLADVMMPGLDGFELVEALRADPALSAVPVLLLSARAGEEARIEGLDAGADDYLTKPFSARELVARVASALELARVRAESDRTLREEARTLETLNRDRHDGRGRARPRARGSARDRCRDRAQRRGFGSFFYNVLDEHGEAYMLYSLSGVPREAFSRFPMPRNTAVFAPTFSGEGIVRSADITARSALRQEHAAPRDARGSSAGAQLSRRRRSSRAPARCSAACSSATPSRRVRRARRTADRRRSRCRRRSRSTTRDSTRPPSAEIAERRQTEAALRESEERFRTMADNAPVMVWVTDAAGACTYLSRSWYEFSGQSEAAGLGFGWLDTVHPDDRARARAIFLEANARQEPFRLEYQLRRADGDYR